MQSISALFWILRDQFKWLHEGFIIHDTSYSNNIYEALCKRFNATLKRFCVRPQKQIKAASKSSLNSIYHVAIKVTETLRTKFHRIFALCDSHVFSFEYQNIYKITQIFSPFFLHNKVQIKIARMKTWKFQKHFKKYWLNSTVFIQ